MPTPTTARRAVRVALLAAGTLTVMAGASITPALPAMREHFASTPGADTWVRLVLTIPALFVVLWAPVAGVIADRFGRKRLLVMSVLLYLVAGASGTLANSIATLLVGRGLLGLAVAGIMTSTLALIGDYLTGRARASFMGLQSAAMAFGGVVFLVVGGLLAGVHWRAAFLVYLAAAPILLIVMLVVAEPARAGSRDNPDEAGPRLASGAVALIYAIGVLLQIAFYVLPVQLPFLLQADMGVGPRGTGLAMGTGALSGATMGLLYGRIQSRLSFQAIVGVAAAVMGTGYLGVAGAREYWHVVASMVLGGSGFGLMVPNLNVWLTAVVPDGARGRAFGGLTTCVCSGQFLSAFVSQPLAMRLGLSATFGVVGLALIGLGAGYTALRRLEAIGRSAAP